MVREAASGKRQKVTKGDIAKLVPLITSRTDNSEWIEEQTHLFDVLKIIVGEIEAILSKRSRRNGWTEHAENQEQIFLGAVLSANISDKKLFEVMLAMQKLGIFSIDKLANYDVRKLQNIFLYCGYNYWTYAPARIIGAAKRIKEEFAGELPSDPRAWEYPYAS